MTTKSKPRRNWWRTVGYALLGIPAGAVAGFFFVPYCGTIILGPRMLNVYWWWFTLTGAVVGGAWCAFLWARNEGPLK